jgi:hypothetical protein
MRKDNADTAPREDRRAAPAKMPAQSAPPAGTAFGDALRGAFKRD